MEDAEESAAGPEAMAAAEAAREAGMRARNQGRRNFNPRTMEALVEDMIEQAYAGDGLEVCCLKTWCSCFAVRAHLLLTMFMCKALACMLKVAGNTQQSYGIGSASCVCPSVFSMPACAWHANMARSHVALWPEHVALVACSDSALEMDTYAPL